MTWDRTRAWVIERREVGLGRVTLKFEAMPLSLTQIAEGVPVVELATD